VDNAGGREPEKDESLVHKTFEVNEYLVKANAGGARRRNWLQNTVKRKLVDFAWNRRFLYLPGVCLPFFG